MIATRPMIVILMGVSGAGKTAVGERLAGRLGWAFHDGDDFHPQVNVAKMAAGQPLTDEDRRPWLAAIRERIEAHERQGSDAIFACSALREEYRSYLLAGAPSARIVYLRGSPSLIEERLRRRRGHFFRVDLLASLFATVEEPSSALVVDVDAEVDVVVVRVVAALGLPAAALCAGRAGTGGRRR
jgi:carbohydrate kinase (thermoresistant glucokinase family)